MSEGQSKAASMAEAITNIFAGVTIAFLSQLIIFDWYHIDVSLDLNLKMTLWFTAISLLRSFVLRRVFNWFTIQ